MNNPGFFVSFGVGLLSFLTPCVLPILPGYLSFLSGASEGGKSPDKAKLLVTSLSFALGFSVIVVALGAAASVFGRILLRNRTFWRKVGGVVIILFGLQALGVLGLGFLNREHRWGGKGWSFWGRGKAFLAGAGFGLGWTPCMGPVLGAILVLASQAGTVLWGMGLLASYALGTAVSLVAVGVFLGRASFLGGKKAQRISGAVLVVLGLLLFFGKFSQLSVWLAGAYRALGVPGY